jgi:nickel-dependent lactate racemase
MQHFFSYYPDNQSLTVPDANAIGLFGPLALSAIDREAVLNEAFANPVNSPQLSKVATAEDRVLIVVDDILEPTPVVFPFFHVIAELHKAGVKDTNIQILISNGASRPSTSEEIDRKIGAEMHKKYRVLQTHGDVKEEHTFGTANTPTGPVAVVGNAALKDASLVVAISGTYPDRFLGFSGSGSVLFPGTSGERATASLVLHAASEPSEKVYGVMETESREFLKHLISFVPAFKFSVDVVLDRKLQIAGCVTGEPVSAYHVAADVAKRICEVEVSEKADIVVLDSHPFDRNLFHAMRPAYAALPMLKSRSAELIIVSPLAEALPANLAALAIHATETRRTIIEASHKAPLMHHPMWAAEMIAMAEVLERTSLVTIVTHGPGKADATKFGFGVRANIQEALSDSLSRMGASARVAVVTHGGLAVLR